MGEKVVATRAELSDRQLYRRKLQSCLDALERMLREGRFDRPKAMVGLEIELNLADDLGRPVMRNEQVLASIASGDFQTELGQFNIELNIAARRLTGHVLDELREEIDTGLRYADRKAEEVGARIAMVGILPTLDLDHTGLDAMSHNDRYTLLSDQILAARGEDIALDIEGVERLQVESVTMVAEAAATSLQLHLQVTPERFAPVWNAAQAIASVQLALGANSPFLFGRELWRETRPVLFQQACDTRSAELKAQGVRPITWFGERWVDSALDLFAENQRYFPPLLPICDDEDPAKVLASGGVPKLAEMRLHNGTIYRWNRPVYDVADGVPHLRVENRCLPAGPTVVDTLANAAFYYGLVRVLAEQPRPIWTRMPFAQADENFHTAARYGIDAVLQWPKSGRGARGSVPVAATELVLNELLPMARQGLDEWGIEPGDRDRYLGIIEQRCLRRTNGAAWQAATVHLLRERYGMDRSSAIAAMTRRYLEHMRGGEPVHTWPVG
ncbi:gamma-glutamyl:cysteine ligase YbdK (ATP-grasp superfamily) [Kitasatospora gansuensis]|uniref:Gamma-glutamyl:cysteine ligase YbdK (ATP-grasp superfamily) n=1 Tax=Kitasatospora gansuensis TaxID=258050 RepID=A0A7W7SHZ9_9ACTN|nr:glutamate-cysteine ligase family protein [Kitasatospora gansuensis]MBB4950830.1 gamma-glutamyl:cysteine ligase YbdK (ATP-grasp superfamily) [Kitasatospora gansuensis]